jgi:hypothetical protein
VYILYIKKKRVLKAKEERERGEMSVSTAKMKGKIYFVLEFERLHTFPESKNFSLEFKRYIYIEMYSELDVYK